MADETSKPAFPQRPTSSDVSLLEGLLGLLPGRLLLALLLILCGAVPYFGVAVYVIAFVGVVAFVIYMFHRAYPAKRQSDQFTAHENEPNPIDSPSSATDDTGPLYYDP